MNLPILKGAWLRMSYIPFKHVYFKKTRKYYIQEGYLPIVKDKKDVKRKLEWNKYNTSSKILNHAPAAELATHLPHRWIASDRGARSLYYRILVSVSFKRGIFKNYNLIYQLLSHV